MTESGNVVATEIESLEFLDVVDERIATQLQIDGRPDVVVRSNGERSQVAQSVQHTATQLTQFAVFDR